MTVSTVPPPPEQFSVSDYLRSHPFFSSLAPELLDEVAPHAFELRVPSQSKVFRQDAAADHFYVVLDGEVTVEVPAIQGEPARLQLLGPGKILGWSWLIPPHRWHFDARATKPSRLLQLDGARLRDFCRNNPVLGYPLLERAAILMMERLGEARLRVIESYTGQ